MTTLDTKSMPTTAQVPGPARAKPWWKAPKARFRINSDLGQYLRLIKSIATNGFEPDEANVRLEEALQERLGVPHAVCVNQGRVGLYLALRSVITAGRQRVVLSPYTIYDVVNMVIAAGGEPVFADVEPDNCNISPVEVARAVDEHTCAVLVTHMHGVAADILPIRKLCDERGLILIEDAAQSFGVRYEGQHLGTIGDMGVFSFGLFKTVNSFFGGAVVCRDAALAGSIRDLQAGFGLNDRKRMMTRLIQGAVFDVGSHPVVFQLATYWLFRHAVMSGNKQMQKLVKSETNPVLRTELPAQYRKRMSGMQAGMILKQLEAFDQEHARRVEVATAYYEALKDVPGVVVPRRHPSDGNACLSYPIQVKDRDDVLRKLMKNGRDCAPQHVNNCADLGIFSQWYRDCPEARRTAKETIILPTYSRYGLQEAQGNIQALLSMDLR